MWVYCETCTFKCNNVINTKTKWPVSSFLFNIFNDVIRIMDCKLKITTKENNIKLISVLGYLLFLYVPKLPQVNKIFVLFRD